MAASYVIYQAVGDSYLFPIPFQFLNPSFIEVSMARGTLQQDLDYNVDGLNIRFLNYPPVGKVTIRRKTPIAALLVPFADGALLNARVMSSATSQSLHGLEEARDYIDAVRDDLIATLTPADSPLIASQLVGMEAALDGVSASVVSEASVRASADSAMATNITSLTTRMNSAESSITTEQTTRASGDLAMATSITTMTTRMNSAESSITTEAAARATSDDAMAYVVNQITAATGGAQALQQTGGVYSATWAAAQANFWTNLKAEVFTSGGTSIRAALTSEASTRASADAAMATNITSLTSRVGAAEAAITTEQTTRASADSTLAGEITTLKSRMGSAESAITTEQTTRASADSANASSITTLTTRMNSAESRITTEASTRATETGALKAQYTVKVDVGGRVAGYGLASEGTVAGGTTSDFSVLADKFKVYIPGYGNYTPFTVGASVVTFNGNTNWSAVQGGNKPLDNSGKVIDGGSGAAPGQRNANDPPSYYPVGKTMQFKWGPDIGITGGGWLSLETNKHYGDNSGGMLTQWAYGQNGLTWKRSGYPTNSFWGAWTQDLDRATYTGDLNATYGASIGGNLSGRFTSANIATFMDNAVINSALIGEAQVGTLKIAGEAVTVPRVFTSSSQVFFGVTYGAWSTTTVPAAAVEVAALYIDSGGGTVMASFTGTVRFTDLVAVVLLAPSGAVIARSVAQNESPTPTWGVLTLTGASTESGTYRVKGYGRTDYGEISDRGLTLMCGKR